MRIIREETGVSLDYKDSRLVDRITSKFNDNLIFGPGNYSLDIVFNIYFF